MEKSNEETLIKLIKSGDNNKIKISMEHNLINWNYTDVIGNTILMIALYTKKTDKEILTRMIELGNHKIQNKDGWTPLMIALKHHQNKEIIEILESKNTI